VTELSREYGEGLYALCVEENLSGEALEQLTQLKALFRENPDFCRLLGNLSLSKAERVNILDGALRDQVHIYVLNFLKILCERGIISEFEGCVEAFRTFYNRDNAVVEAVVTTSVPLDENRRQQLLEKLRTMTARKLQLVEKVDPAVMGGVLLEMEGKRYDNTLRHRLKEMRQMLTSEN
jgi:F-type H+-transporting ATPase subunit delta